MRRRALAAWEHQDLPFEKLVEAVRPERALAHAPVFQTMFVLQNVPWEAASLPGLEIAPAETDPPDTAKYDLTLSATEYAGEIWLAFEYSTDLFDEATVARLSAHYEALLRGAIAAPETRVDDLPLHEDADSRERLRAWRGPAPSPVPQVGVHRLVEDRVRETPLAIAIESAGRRWSYAGLDDWADALADRLRGLGAGRGAVVGICLDRSPELIGAMLGVAKSGAAWLPLDPAFPGARLRFMLEDSGARWLVTARDLVQGLPAFDGGVLCVEDLAPAACAAAATPADAVAADDPVYLIYTSGSTGRPKGVPITHGGVANFLVSMLREPGFGATDRLLAVTTPSFDIAVLELLGPLCAGGTVVVATAADTRDGAALARRLDDERITVMQATPATWRALFAAGWQGRAGLKALCGGEALDPELAARLLAGTGALWNMYGPTETTIWSTCGEIRAADDISIGRPIANTQLCVLDVRGRPAPSGVPGELCIGGAGVAPGYHGRPELTRERFVRDRHGVADGGVLYRTGDRARFLNDGRLRILGRLDRQVKVRGFRIEPGEVEAALGALPGVAGCAVAVREAAPGDARLVAWVVGQRGEGGAGLEAGALRGALRRQLPDHLVPSAFVVLERLPLTPNGKLDRQALPAPVWGAGGAGRAAAARSAREATLCALFAEVLGGAGVGICDDFFALGGHSLLATRLVSRIRDELGVELALRELFTHPTVADLGPIVAALPQAMPKSSRGGLIPRRVPAATAPLSFAQQRLWFLDQLEPGNAAYNLHTAFRLHGAVDATALERALQLIVARHEALRTTFAVRDGEPVQVIHPPDGASSAVRLARLDLCGLSPAGLRERLVVLGEEPFDLGAGPLVRATLARCGNDEQVLLIVLHHIVGDGWSLAVLVRELSAAYAACARGVAPDLAPLPIQYADYAHWQRQALASGELERQLAYWTERLRGAPTLISLPNDRPRLPVQRYRGAWHSVTVPAALTASLGALAQREQATLFMVLLAAFEVLLARFGGDEDLAIGVPIAGRNRTELEGLVGFFVNTLVLRGDLRGNPAFGELLARVRRAALDAYARADVPFERLVEALDPQRSRAWSPLTQVLFVFHNEPRADLHLAGVEVTGEIVANRSAKFDLSLHVALHGDVLIASFGYNTDLFDPGTVAAMAAGYVTLLDGIGRDAGQRVGDLELLDEDARARAEAEAARVRPRVPFIELPAAGGTIPRLFVAQVAARPERVAVSWPEKRGPAAAAKDAALCHWTYAGLAARARSLAARILAVTDGGAGRIALLLGHDGPMVAGILAVLETGKAYVPLDPYAPRQRTEWMLRDAGAAAIVTDAAHLASAPWLADSGLPVVVMDEAAHVSADRLPSRRAGVPACGQPGADDLAYILYTSGTTGHPKGVAQAHGHVVGHIASWTRQLHINADDRVALFSGYGYDAAVQDVFGALLNGASVHALDLRGGASAAELVDRVARERLTVLHMTPTVYRHLFGGRVTCDQDLGAVRLVVLGGEAARRSDLDLFKVRFRRGTVFANGLGMTESTMALQYFADHDTRVLGQRLPVGRAVPGIGVRLCNADHGSAPWHGEIALSNPHLAPGYHGRADALADRSGDWHTGDLARRLPDGQLLHTGRTDDQVKIRGIRIEPAEIEAALRSDPSIHDCIVLARENEPDDAVLVAYVVAVAGRCEAQALRAGLRVLLPEYLVPSRFVPLATLPRLPNGKVDRRALPDPAPDSLAPGVVVPARTELEKRLAVLWSGVLKRAPIGIHDDFFALGGHSLLATRLIARVRDAFGLEVPLVALFEGPTIAGMADAIERAGVRPRDTGLPALTRRRRAAGSDNA